MQHFLGASLTTLIDEDGENVSIYRKFLYDREESLFEEQTTRFFLDDVSEIVVKRSDYILIFTFYQLICFMYHEDLEKREECGAVTHERY